MVTIERVDEAGAQRLADETGKVVYAGVIDRYKHPLQRCMTTDRDEAVAWGEFVAFVPQREPWQPATAAHVDSHHLAGNLGELARRTVGERQAGDRYESQRQYPRSRTADDPDHAFIAEPEPQLRVVRVLEYRGPQSQIEKILARSFVTPIRPRTGTEGTLTEVLAAAESWEIVEQIRTTERLCRWCGGEHLGACSEDGCSGNPRKGKY